MAPAKADSLSTLGSSLGEVLVQTGKALKSCARDEPGGVSGVSSAIRHRSQEALKTYHLALDDIESEILRAKAALLRDLAKLRAARAPPPPPTPPPEQQQIRSEDLKHETAKAPTVAVAPMLDMPSTAAHTMNHQAFVPEPKMNPVVPFPDMGSDMSSSDILSIAHNETKPLNRMPTASMQTPSASTPQLKTEAIPSPVLAMGPRNTEDSLAHRPGMPFDSKVANSSNESAPVATMFDLTADGTTGVHSTSSEAPEFTNMQFSLDTSAAGIQNAPPAPMPAFDLTTFTNTGPQGEFPNGPTFDSLGNDTNLNISTSTNKRPPNGGKNLDDVFDLDGGADGMDLDLDLGNGGVNDSTFDDLFLDTGDNTGMGQFDNAFFGLD